MRFMHYTLLLAALDCGSMLAGAGTAPNDFDRWRMDHRAIDVHQHLTFTTQHLARAVKIMDASGVGIAVNLGIGTVTPGTQGTPSEFERNKRLADTLYPGRILHYMTLDYQGFDGPDFSARAVRQVEEGHRLGAAGLKEFKRLGLFLRDGAGKLIRIDDPRLDPVWRRCGELGMPVSIHVADPKAFWLPFNDQNERWQELKDHAGWWFGDTNKYPAWKDLLEMLNRVMERHPETTFVSVHFGNNAEELEWVDAALSRFPNMMVDLAARIPEIGRQDPDTVRRLFIKHQDRILFGTDFMVYDRLILGSSGKEPPPSDSDAVTFFQKHWRWLETQDRNWEHMTPIQGNWTISSIGLPGAVLEKIYFNNARKLLARSLPTPVVRARHVDQDIKLDGRLDDPAWQTAAPVFIECAIRDGAVRTDLSTAVRVLWSDRYLFLSYVCPYTRLTVFEPPQLDHKRFDLNAKGTSLWDRDVVEAFIGSDTNNLLRYAELQVAPTNERLDLLITRLPDRDFSWSSGFESAVSVDNKKQVWTCEMRIPLTSLSQVKPSVGTRWPLGLFRCDYANNALLTWRSPLGASFHTPERFGILEFGK